MVSDSDGKNFPWYGSKSEVAIIKGPLDFPTIHKVVMNDNFCPHVTWNIPVSETTRTVTLTNIKRNQKFYTWLVAMDLVHGHLIILKTYKWKIRLEIEVDPSKKLGERAKLVSDPRIKQPCELKTNKSIPSCALYPSNANSCQILRWCPVQGKSSIVISQKCFSHSPKLS